MGADAVDVPVYYIRQTLLSLWSETVALYSDPLTPVLSHVASINVSSDYEVIKVGVGKPGYEASELEQAVFVLVCSSLALVMCKCVNKICHLGVLFFTISRNQMSIQYIANSLA